jgi:hypothetical protein
MNHAVHSHTAAEKEFGGDDRFIIDHRAANERSVADKRSAAARASLSRSAMEVVEIFKDREERIPARALAQLVVEQAITARIAKENQRTAWLVAGDKGLRDIVKLCPRRLGKFLHDCAFEDVQQGKRIDGHEYVRKAREAGTMAGFLEGDLENLFTCERTPSRRKRSPCPGRS